MSAGDSMLDVSTVLTNYLDQIYFSRKSKLFILMSYTYMRFQYIQLNIIYTCNKLFGNGVKLKFNAQIIQF